MKVQSIGNYYVPKYNNTGRISAKQNDITFKSEYYDKKSIKAYTLSCARNILQERKEELSEMKNFALTQEHTDYKSLENLEASITAQKQLVRKLENEYAELNPSGDGFEYDVDKGREIIVNYCKEHNILPGNLGENSEDPFNGDPINVVMGVPIGDFPFYAPS